VSTEKHIKHLTLEQAQQIILERAVAGTEVLELPIIEAVDQVLAEDICSPIDMPAFDRSAMDGFAFRHADHTNATGDSSQVSTADPGNSTDPATKDTFRIVTTIAAGQAPGAEIGPGECAQIMTGAPLPTGADTVIPVEETSLLTKNTMPDTDSEFETASNLSHEWVHFHTIPAQGQHVAPQGEDVRQGDVVLKQGRLLSHQEIAVLASMGRPKVVTHAGPSIAFAATGEELVEPGNPLAPGQIYNANAYCLWTQINAAQGRPHYLGVIRDDEEDLREKIAAGLNHDILILSGGVSMGKFDFVPQILDELGVELHIRKLLVKPGRPTVFGTRGRTQVFGLPGNPISTLYAFSQYVAPSIRVFRQHPQPSSINYQGKLAETVRKKAGRVLLLPCISEWRDQGYLLNPLKTHGSADIFAIGGADVMALIPANLTEIEKGAQVDFRKLYES